MAKVPFDQFLKKYGIRLLPASFEGIVPGSLLKRKRKSYSKLGDVDQILKRPKGTFDSTLQEANLVTMTVERRLSLKGKASLSEFGVDVDGGLSRAKSVTFKISDVKAKEFKTQSKLTIWPDLMGLRRSDRRTWRQINNAWLVDYTYYASEAVVEFEVDAGVNLKADLENRVKASGESEVKWTSSKSFKISGNPAVPFGFSGWKI